MGSNSEFRGNKKRCLGMYDEYGKFKHQLIKETLLGRGATQCMMNMENLD